MSKKADKELRKLAQRKRGGCEYWDCCETCPYPKCKDDCVTINQFLCPMRYECIKMCFKTFASVALLTRALGVSRRTIYMALEKED